LLVEIEEIKAAAVAAVTASESSSNNSSSNSSKSSEDVLSSQEVKDLIQKVRDECEADAELKLKAKIAEVRAQAQAETEAEAEAKAQAQAQAQESAKEKDKEKATSDEIKDIMQDVYTKACEIFVPDDETASTSTTYTPKDVIKRLRVVLKAVTSQRTPS